MKLLMTAAVLVVVPLSACGSQAPSAVVAGPAAPASVPAGEDQLTAGFDEPPDGEIRPDSSLSAAEVTKLLRVRATDPGTPTRCVAADVRAAIEGFDAALGHRFGRLVLTNTSGRTCSVSGYPGLGARGKWGNAFLVAVEQRDSLDSLAKVNQVKLVPGAKAHANLEWTGELAGAESESISMLVIQLAQDQEAFGFPAVAEVDYGESPHLVALDIGMLSTVRIGPFQRSGA